MAEHEQGSADVRDDGAPQVVVPERVPEGLRLGFLGVLTVSCLVLAPWIVILGVELPKRYVAAHWDVAWVGFDTALLLGLLVTAWAAWRRRQIVIVTAIVTATLLLSDAWFDVTTARASQDRLLSMLTALLIEIPLALLLLGAALRLITVTVRTVRATLDGDPGRVRLWRVPLLLSDTATEQEARLDRRHVSGDDAPLAHPGADA
ncbi:MAG: hypothetical protein ACM3OO_06625 [Planctomycetaceae bacterium]